VQIDFLLSEVYGSPALPEFLEFHPEYVAIEPARCIQITHGEDDVIE
jgi:hypothetical protein